AARGYRRLQRGEVSARAMSRSEAIATLPADWPAPANVRAFTTLRTGPGASGPPFDSFNLGLRSGDDAAAVQRNRVALHGLAATPSAPHWLQQVHGTDVARFRAEDGGERI